MEGSYYHVIYNKGGNKEKFYIQIKIGKNLQSFGSINNEKEAAIISDLLLLYFNEKREKDRYLNFPDLCTYELSRKIIPNYNFKESIKKKIKKLEEELIPKNETETSIKDLEAEEIMEEIKKKYYR